MPDNLIIPSDDFWSRRESVQSAVYEVAPFGNPGQITANHPDILDAARLSIRRFSQLSEPVGLPIEIKIVVRSGSDGPLPPDLPEKLVYSGVGPWITVSAGDWGHAFANLDTREAVIVLAFPLAAEIRLVSRYFIDHYLLNFILAEWAMLHASCVLSADRQRLIAMIGPHNMGKSTTALQLLRAGYSFLADGMALVRQDKGNFMVGGYPIGEVKLRDDVLSLFPEYSGHAVRVREQQKTVVNLRLTEPERVTEAVVEPSSIFLCFIERSDSPQTRLQPLPASEAARLLATNTIFWAESPRLAYNSDTLQALLRVATAVRLAIGNDVSSIISAIDELI